MTAQMFGRSETFIKPMKVGNPELENLSNFQIVMILSNQDNNVKQGVQNFFELVFPIYDVEINQNDFVFKIKDEETIVGMINGFNYESFFQIVRDLFLMQSPNKDEIAYDPANERAKSIAEKLKKGREKVAEIKNKEGGNENMSVFGTYTSVLSIGMHMDINIFYNYTPFQLYDAFSRYWAKTSSDFYQKLASTPLMDVSKMDAPKEWSSNLYK